MDVLQFTFRLLKNGGIFVLRVAGILLPVLGGAIAAGMSYNARQVVDDYTENDCGMAAMTGYFPNGESCYSDVRCLKYMDD